MKNSLFLFLLFLSIKSFAQTNNHDSIIINDKTIARIELISIIDTTILTTNIQNYEDVKQKVKQYHYKLYIDDKFTKSELIFIKNKMEEFITSNKKPNSIFEWSIEFRFANLTNFQIAGIYFEDAGKLKNLGNSIFITSSILGTTLSIISKPMIGAGTVLLGSTISIIIYYRSNQKLIKAGQLLQMHKY